MSFKKTLHEYTSVAVVSASIVFAIYNLGKGTLHNNPTMDFLAATGLYVLLFKLILSLYSKYLWQIVNRKVLITGNWRYHYDTYTDATKKNIKSNSGEMYVHHDIEGIRLSGESVDQLNDSKASIVKTMWYTSMCTIHGDTISSSLTVSNEKGQGIGFFLINIKKANSFKSPQEMRGHFYFMIGNSNYYGRVLFLKQ